MTWNDDRERIIAAAELGDAAPQVAADLLVAARKLAFDAEQKAQQLQTALEALKAAHTWIKTSDRMPDKDARKIPVVIKNKETRRIEIADYYFGSWSIGDIGNALERYESVTHWMPRLELP